MDLPAPHQPNPTPLRASPIPPQASPVPTHQPPSAPNYQPTEYSSTPPYQPQPTPPYQPPTSMASPQFIPMTQPQNAPVYMMSAPNFGETPIQTICSSCRNAITTVTYSEDSTMQHVLCFVMFLFGLWCCSCLPYCMDSMQNVMHHCPQCNAHLGTYKP